MLIPRIFYRLAMIGPLALATVSAAPSGLAQVRFEAPVNLSSNPTDSWNPDIAARDEQVFVFWTEKGNALLAHSTDLGKMFRTWHLSPGMEVSYRPNVAADGDNIYVGWSGAVSVADPLTHGLYIARSHDRGRTFSPPTPFSRRWAGNTPQMRIKDGVLNLACGAYNHEFRSQDVIFAKSADFGKTFSEPVRIHSNPPGMGSDLMQLALDGDSVYLAWMNHRAPLAFYEIYFARSTDGGKTFGEVLNLSQSSDPRGFSSNPQLGAGPKGYVYAAWTQGLDIFPSFPVDVYFARSTDGGKTFGERINLSKDPLALNGELRMAAASRNIYVVWTARNRTVLDVFLSRSRDGGETFSPPQNLWNNPRSAVAPQIALLEQAYGGEPGASEDIIYLVWQTGSEIFFSLSFDSGNTFSEPENISNNPSFSNGPRLAAAGHQVYVTWMDNPARNWDVLFVRGELELANRSRLSTNFRETFSRKGNR